MKHTLSLSLLAMILAGCASTPSPKMVADLNDEARKTAGGMIQTLGGELKAAMTAGGPAEAIVVCKEKAPKIAAEAAARTGMRIKRVSLKNRNPKGVPDAWETEALAGLEQRLAAGEKPETLDTHSVVNTPDGKVFRYAKALVMQPVCVNCHGAAENLSPEVKAKLATEYPEDKATGYTPGMIRGVLSIKKSL
ncbi:MAG: cytochrome c family protein [Hydrogenophilales bacterium 28-61-23]|nr:MAG: cytochrome c family protein [Hydrogenophilales bacterium 28-61-23]